MGHWLVAVKIVVEIGGTFSDELCVVVSDTGRRTRDAIGRRRKRNKKREKKREREPVLHLGRPSHIVWDSQGQQLEKPVFLEAKERGQETFFFVPTKSTKSDFGLFRRARSISFPVHCVRQGKILLIFSLGNNNRRDGKQRGAVGLNSCGHLATTRTPFFRQRTIQTSHAR